MPSWKRVRNARRTATSISASVMRPFFTAPVRAAYVRPQFTSSPLFTASAAASSGVATILWNFQTSSTESQSETT
jgi:hypothetical protein